MVSITLLNKTEAVLSKNDSEFTLLKRLVFLRHLISLPFAFDQRIRHANCPGNIE